VSSRALISDMRLDRVGERTRQDARVPTRTLRTPHLFQGQKAVISRHQLPGADHVRDAPLIPDHRRSRKRRHHCFARHQLARTRGIARVPSDATAAVSLDRKADRLLSSRPGMVRLDSNENRMDRVSTSTTQSSNISASRSLSGEGEVDLTETIARTSTSTHPTSSSLRLRRTAAKRGSSLYLVDGWLVSPAPTFESPATFAKALERPIASPKVDSKLMLDLDANGRRRQGAGLVYLCNPNNPTATVHGRATSRRNRSRE